MAHILVRHKVADFDKWKPLFEDHRPVREAASLKNLYLWRNERDPNDIIVLFEASDLAKAKEFLGSSELKIKMQEDGVQGAPEIVFLSES